MKHKGNNSSWQFIKLSHRGWFPWGSFWNVNLTTNSGSCVHAYNQDFTLLHHDCCTPMLIHPHWPLLATSTQHETKLWERSADCCGERWTVTLDKKEEWLSINARGGGWGEPWSIFTAVNAAVTHRSQCRLASTINKDCLQCTSASLWIMG